MKNLIMLYKTDDGEIYCQEISKKGVEYVETDNSGDYWEEGVVITLDKIEALLDKEVFVDEQQNKKE